MRDTLIEILASSADPAAVDWLRTAVGDQASHFEKRPFYYAFSGVSRHFDRRAVVSAPKLPEVDGWDEFRVARVILLLVLAQQDEKTFFGTYASLLATADIRESVALFSALRWMPCSEGLIEHAVDGLRTNIVDVFDSIALDNPFPKEHFSEASWNQMVLKAIFLARPLYRIDGIDERKNADLATAISDLAHERWAAGRTITPEAWRNVVGFVDGGIEADLLHLVDSGNPDEEAAARIVRGDAHDGVTWESIGRKLDSTRA